MDLKKLWKSIPEPKAVYHNFYNRIRRWYTVEEAKQPWFIHYKHWPTREKWPLRMYWEAYEWEKCAYWCFRDRVNKRLIPKEEAIKVFLPKKEISKSLIDERARRQWNPQKTHAQAKAERHHEDYYEIAITMNPEEASIYHRIYQEMIAEINEKILLEEDLSKLKELEQKLSKTKQEYQVFLSFNPYKPWMQHYAE